MTQHIDQRLTEQYKKYNKAMTPKQFAVGMALILAFAYFSFTQPLSFIGFYFMIGSALFLLSALFRYSRKLKVLDQIAAEAHQEGLHWDNEAQRFRYIHHWMICNN